MDEEKEDFGALAKLYAAAMERKFSKEVAEAFIDSLTDLVRLSPFAFPID